METGRITSHHITSHPHIATQHNTSYPISYLTELVAGHAVVLVPFHLLGDTLHHLLGEIRLDRQGVLRKWVDKGW